MEGLEADSGARLLVLGAGPGQLGLLAEARAQGLYVVAIDRDPGAPGFRYADRRAIVSVEDEPGIDRLASAERVDGVIAPGIDFPVAIAARVAERLRLPHPLEPATALLTVSKVRQRERFAEAGVPHTRFASCASLAEAEVVAARFGFPCIVKAPDRQGQKGLSLVHDAPALRDAFEHAVAEARIGVALVEELVEGRELTVNAFSVAGRFHPLTVTDRIVAEPPAFGVALAHVWPSEVEAGVAAAAVEVARTAAEALGIREGPSYTQVLVGPDGPVVGELAARLGGGHDAELAEAALDVNLNGLAVSAALGVPVSESELQPAPAVGGACVLFLVPPVGTLHAVDGIEEAEGMDGVLWARAYRGPGFAFGEFRRGSDRAGAVLAVGESREQALARAEAAAERIRFEIADAEALV